METYKYLKVYHKIIDDIEKGYLVYNQKIPSIRQMVESLQVSKITVENAYAQLQIEGYIYSKNKIGYFVDVQSTVLSNKQNNQTSQIERTQHYDYDFSGRSVNPQAIHVDTWKKYVKRVFDEPMDLLSYGDPFGEPILIKSLQNYVGQHRGVHRSIDSYVVGAGFQTLLSQICHLLPSGSMVAMDTVGFLQAEVVFENCSMPVMKIPVDQDGILIEELEKHPIKLLYLHSSSGYHGKSIKKQRRNELVEYARRNKVYIIEDDHNGELLFDSKPVRPMACEDDQWIIYIGSFSKILLPSIRMSYLALPNTLIDLFKQRNGAYHQTSSKLEQIALANYINDGQLARQVKRVRKYYGQIGHYLLTALQQTVKQDTFELHQTPLKIVCTSKKTNCDQLINDAKKHSMNITINSKNQIVFSFASITIEQIDEAMKILQIIW